MIDVARVVSSSLELEEVLGRGCRAAHAHARRASACSILLGDIRATRCSRRGRRPGARPSAPERLSLEEPSLGPRRARGARAAHRPRGSPAPGADGATVLAVPLHVRDQPVGVALVAGADAGAHVHAGRALPRHGHREPARGRGRQRAPLPRDPAPRRGARRCSTRSAARSSRRSTSSRCSTPASGTWPASSTRRAAFLALVDRRRRGARAPRAWPGRRARAARRPRPARRPAPAPRAARCSTAREPVAGRGRAVATRAWRTRCSAARPGARACLGLPLVVRDRAIGVGRHRRDARAARLHARRGRAGRGHREPARGRRRERAALRGPARGATPSSPARSSSSSSTSGSPRSASSRRSSPTRCATRSASSSTRSARCGGCSGPTGDAQHAPRHRRRGGGPAQPDRRRPARLRPPLHARAPAGAARAGGGRAVAAALAQNAAGRRGPPRARTRRCRPSPIDARLVRQAVLNVAVNAVQAMPRGGRLTVRRGRDGDGARALEIEDTGAGHPGRGPRPHLRAVLHHQGERHRARARGGEAHRRGARRRGGGAQPSPARDGLRAPASARSRRAVENGAGDALRSPRRARPRPPADASRPGAPRSARSARSSSSTTRRTCARPPRSCSAQAGHAVEEAEDGAAALQRIQAGDVRRRPHRPPHADRRRDGGAARGAAARAGDAGHRDDRLRHDRVRRGGDPPRAPTTSSRSRSRRTSSSCGSRRRSRSAGCSAR